MQPLSDLPPHPRLDATVFALVYVALFKYAHSKRIFKSIDPVKYFRHFSSKLLSAFLIKTNPI